MKNYVVIFCLLSLVAKSQTWQKIGSFTNYWNQSKSIQGSTSFDFNQNFNKLYSSYINIFMPYEYFEAAVRSLTFVSFENAAFYTTTA